MALWGSALRKQAPGKQYIIPLLYHEDTLRIATRHRFVNTSCHCALGKAIRLGQNRTLNGGGNYSFWKRKGVREYMKERICSAEHITILGSVTCKFSWGTCMWAIERNLSTV